MQLYNIYRNFNLLRVGVVYVEINVFVLRIMSIDVIDITPGSFVHVFEKIST